MDIKNISTEDIEKRLSGITAEMAQIKAQIGNAKGYAAATGEYANSQWYNKANLALRIKGREHQALQLEYGKRRRAERRAYNANVEQNFIQVARLHLDTAKFQEIMDEAVARTTQEDK